MQYFVGDKIISKKRKIELEGKGSKNPLGFNITCKEENRRKDDGGAPALLHRLLHALRRWYRPFGKTTIDSPVPLV
jgi:hypothetical protein